MFLKKNKLIKEAKKIAKKDGATPKNKILINQVLNYLKENDMTPEDFEKELREGKGKFIVSIVSKDKNINNFLNNFFVELKKEYYKDKK